MRWNWQMVGVTLAVIGLAGAAGCTLRQAAPPSPSRASSESTRTPSTASVATSSPDDGTDPSYAYARGLAPGIAVKKGSAGRAAILDALRVPVEKDLHQSVKFDVQTIRTASVFAGVAARAVKPNGDPVDYRHTQYQHWIDEGAFDDGLVALLKKSGGRWHVLQYENGVTDSPTDSWLYQYRVPSNVFKY